MRGPWRDGLRLATGRDRSAAAPIDIRIGAAVARVKGNSHEALQIISSTNRRADSGRWRFAGLRPASRLGERVGNRRSQVHRSSGVYRHFPSRPTSRTGGCMSNHGSHIDADQESGDPGPYWRRMHRDWRFWVGAFFMASALAIYVLSGDLAWVPRHAPHAPPPAMVV